MFHKDDQFTTNWNWIFATSYNTWYTVLDKTMNIGVGGLVTRNNILYNQAGLSWETILKKKENFFKAFDDFSIDKVARYSDKKKEKLMQDAGIIRNRLKIEAAVHNAKAIHTYSKGRRVI